MIFVILGTQDKKFTRLIEEVEKLKKENIITEDVVIQSGNTEYESDLVKIIPFMNKEEFVSNIKNSKYIISHGGVGSIMDSIKLDKKVIVVPRLKKYLEHENDHQLQIAKEFADLGYIIDSKGDLSSSIKMLDTFKARKYVPNNSKMISTIEDYIDNI